MALVQIEFTPGGRMIWVKLSQAAKLVSQGQARYVAAVAEVDPGPTVELVAAAPASAQTRSKKGRR